MKLFRRFHLTNVIGAKGEDIAALFLKKAGLKILERNYRNKKGKALGEIDIVAREGGMIVFVEVKARDVMPGQDVFPEENIRPEKLRRLARIGELWMKERGVIGEPYRFDALAIRFNGEKEPEIRHIRNIYL